MSEKNSGSSGEFMVQGCLAGGRARSAPRRSRPLGRGLGTSKGREFGASGRARLRGRSLSGQRLSHGFQLRHNFLSFSVTLFFVPSYHIVLFRPQNVRAALTASQNRSIISERGLFTASSINSFSNHFIIQVSFCNASLPPL